MVSAPSRDLQIMLDEYSVLPERDEEFFPEILVNCFFFEKERCPCDPITRADSDFHRIPPLNTVTERISFDPLFDQCFICVTVPSAMAYPICLAEPRQELEPPDLPWDLDIGMGSM